jgi:hypothetical protein
MNNKAIAQNRQNYPVAERSEVPRFAGSLRGGTAAGFNDAAITRPRHCEEVSDAAICFFILMLTQTGLRKKSGEPEKKHGWFDIVK